MRNKNSIIVLFCCLLISNKIFASTYDEDSGDICISGSFKDDEKKIDSSYSFSFQKGKWRDLYCDFIPSLENFFGKFTGEANKNCIREKLAEKKLNYFHLYKKMSLVAKYSSHNCENSSFEYNKVWNLVEGKLTDKDLVYSDLNRDIQILNNEIKAKKQELYSPDSDLDLVTWNNCVEEMAANNLMSQVSTVKRQINDTIQRTNNTRDKNMLYAAFGTVGVVASFFGFCYGGSTKESGVAVVAGVGSAMMTAIAVRGARTAYSKNQLAMNASKEMQDSFGWIDAKVKRLNDIQLPN